MNPAGKVFTARRARLHRRADPAPRRVCDLRRGLRAPRLRRRAPHPADDAARHARAHRADRLGRQDLLADRLEGRLRHRAGRAAPTSPRRTSSSPSRRRPTCSRRSPSGSARTTPTSPRSGELEVKRDRLAAGLARSGSRWCPAGHLLHHRRHGAARPRRRRCGALPADHVEAGVTAIPVSAFYDSRPRRSICPFCFSKRDAVLDEAVERLRRAFRRRGVDGSRVKGLNARPRMAGIAQLVERQVVVLDVTGSSPVARPIRPTAGTLRDRWCMGRSGHGWLPAGWGEQRDLNP